MARGDKSAYTSKQKRKAEHIEDSYQDRGLSKGESERRAWATVNKQDGGGKKAGSGKKKASGKTGTSGGRSKVSKRTTRKAANKRSTSKTKSTGKSRK